MLLHSTLQDLMEKQEIFKNQVPTVMKNSSGTAYTTFTDILK